MATHYSAKKIVSKFFLSSRTSIPIPDRRQLETTENTESAEVEVEVKPIVEG